MDGTGSDGADKAMAAPKPKGRRTVLKALSAGALGGALALSGRAGQQAGAQAPTPTGPGPQPGGQVIPTTPVSVSPDTGAAAGQLTPAAAALTAADLLALGRGTTTPAISALTVQDLYSMATVFSESGLQLAAGGSTSRAGGPIIVKCCVSCCCCCCA